MTPPLVMLIRMDGVLSPCAWPCGLGQDTDCQPLRPVLYLTPYWSRTLSRMPPLSSLIDCSTPLYGIPQ